MGYYETVGGGSGAVSIFAICSLTPEVLTFNYKGSPLAWTQWSTHSHDQHKNYWCRSSREKVKRQIISGMKALLMSCPFRYPVTVLSFSINKGSGGKGRFDGGNGIIREILFRKPLVLSVLSERRVFSPYGMKGTYIIFGFALMKWRK